MHDHEQLFIMPEGLYCPVIVLFCAVSFEFEDISVLGSYTLSLYKYLLFICPCIASISLKYNQQDATFSRSIYFYKLLYVFQAVSPAIFRSTKLYIQRQVLSYQYCCHRG